MKKRIIKITVSIVVCLLLEIVFSNYTAISMKLSGCEPTEIDMKNTIVSNDENPSYKIENGKIVIEEGKIRFENVNAEMKNICIETDEGFDRYYPVEISFTDDNFVLENGFKYNRNTFKMYVSDNYKNYFSHQSFGEIKTLELNFPNKAISPFKISAITINKIPEFHFHFFRFGILLLLCFCIFNRAWKWKFTNSDTLILIMGTALACLLIVLALLSVAKISDEPMFDVYPLENEYEMDQYEQLFCSFKEGRLDIKVDFDKEQFDNLQNVYDKSERDEAGLTGDHWDRAYYKVKFYSYFGVAPVFTIYFPVYFLTGKLPGEVCAAAIAAIYAVIFLSLLYIAILKYLCNKVPYFIAIMGYLSFLFGSSVFALCTDKYFYFIAVISGIGALAAFLYFLLKAYFEKKFSRRIIFLILSGISVVMIAASRPTICIYCVTAIVPAVFILAGKDDTLKRKIIYVVSIGVPILLGAVGIMTYNYLRFENPFEFGFNYQLTVSIAEANTLTLAYIPATIYHYFIQQPYFKSQFPYIEINNRSLSSYPHYTYLGNTMGVLTYPASWGIFAIPFVDKKKDKFKSFFTLTLFVTALLLAFIDMCKAGSHYRYTADILVPIILVGLITLFDVLKALENAPKKIYLTAYVFVILLMVLTVVVGYLLIFANENQYYINDYSSITKTLRSF